MPSVSVTSWKIIVADDGPGFPDLSLGIPEGRGVGLRNTRDRLQVLFGSRQTFELSNRKPAGRRGTVALALRDAAPGDGLICRSQYGVNRVSHGKCGDATATADLARLFTVLASLLSM